MSLSRRAFVAGVAGSVLAPHSRADAAPPPGTIYRIGFIVLGAPHEVRHLAKALDDGLRELNYVEGQHFVYERRYAEGVAQRLDALAADLAKRSVDVIVTGSNPVISAARRATARIPIVMAVSRDPVGLRIRCKHRPSRSEHYRPDERSRAEDHRETRRTVR